MVTRQEYKRPTAAVMAIAATAAEERAAGSALAAVGVMDLPTLNHILAQLHSLHDVWAFTTTCRYQAVEAQTLVHFVGKPVKLGCHCLPLPRLRYESMMQCVGGSRLFMMTQLAACAVPDN